MLSYTDLSGKSKAQEYWTRCTMAEILKHHDFRVMPLEDDFLGADWILLPLADPTGSCPIFVQQKGRAEVAKKYLGKRIYIAFPDHRDPERSLFLVPHAVLMEWLPDPESSVDWKKNGRHHWGKPSTARLEALEAAGYRYGLEG
jgi:hypothetical protein